MAAVFKCFWWRPLLFAFGKQLTQMALGRPSFAVAASAAASAAGQKPCKHFACSFPIDALSLFLARSHICICLYLPVLDNENHNNVCLLSVCICVCMRLCACMCVCVLSFTRTKMLESRL